MYCVKLLLFAASAIHCYQCESSQTPNCAENLEADESMKVDCNRILAPSYTTTLLGHSSNATGCMKRTMQKGKFQGTGIIVYLI